MGTPRKRPPRIKKPPPSPTPPLSKPWDRPAPPKIGDATEDITYASVGRALSNWEAFDSQLGDIFASSLGSNFLVGVPLVRAYGTVVSFSARVEMIKAAMEAVFFENREQAEMSGLKAKFDDLVERAVKFSARRNDIAHGVVVGRSKKESGMFFRGPLTYYLVPSYYATKKHRLEEGGLMIKTLQTPLYQYSSSEIDAFGKSFWAMAKEAEEFERDFLAFCRSKS